MIRLLDATIEFQGEALFKQVSWHVGDTERVGLVGPNGSGKTTLLRLILGELTPHRGRLERSKHLRLGYLPQVPITHKGRSLLDEAMQCFSSVLALQEQQRRIEEELSRLDSDSPEHKEYLERYGHLASMIEHADLYSLPYRAERVLCGLGFSLADLKRPTDEFSGGWQMRIALAKILLSEPDYLLLDEPTNHLDIESMAWLEGFLDEFPGAMVVVSHDRYFLDRTVKRIVELEHGALTEYHTNYTGYVAERQKRRQVQEARAAKVEQQIAHLQSFVDRFKSRKDKARLAKDRQKKIEKLHQSEEVALIRPTKTIHFSFPSPPPCGRVIAKLEDVRHRFDGLQVLSDVNLTVERGEVVAFIGANGAGKSTLLRILVGELQPTAGRAFLDSRAVVAYFAQEEHRVLNPNSTVLDEVEAVSPMEMRSRVRGLLGAFLFQGDDVFKPVRVLSGGEKSRLHLAKMLLLQRNLLVFDEPTNHLDAGGSQVLEDALDSYEGTVVIVTHDRRLIDRIATKVVEVSKGHTREFPGNYSDYLWKKQQEEAAAQAPGLGERGEKRPRERAATTTAGTTTARDRKERRRTEAQRRAKLTPYKRTLEEIEKEIDKLEAQREETEVELAEPDLYKDSERAKEVNVRFQEIKERLERLYERWAEAAARLEEAQRDPE